MKLKTFIITLISLSGLMYGNIYPLVNQNDLENIDSSHGNYYFNSEIDNFDDSSESIKQINSSNSSITKKSSISSFERNNNTINSMDKNKDKIFDSNASVQYFKTLNNTRDYQMFVWFDNYSKIYEKDLKREFDIEFIKTWDFVAKNIALVKIKGQYFPKFLARPEVKMVNIGEENNISKSITLSTQGAKEFSGYNYINSAGYDGFDIVVAVIDTGIDVGFSDLSDPNLVLAWKDFSVDNYSYPQDFSGHGTAVASVIAGSGVSNSVYKGIAPGVKLVVAKATDDYGHGTKLNTIDAFNWIVQTKDTYGTDIVSISLGWPSFDGNYSNYGFYDEVAQAADDAVAAGLSVVVAAGNDGDSYLDPCIESPGTAHNVITVGNLVDPVEGGWDRSSDSANGPYSW